MSTSRRTATPAVAQEIPVSVEREPGEEPLEGTEVQEEEVAQLVHVPASSAALASLDEIAQVMLEDSAAGHGFEKGDVALPFMRVLQSNSPQAKKKNAKYIDGAEEGYFYNSGSGQVFNGDDGIDVVVAAYGKQATLWTPRVSDDAEGSAGGGGGGFIREVPMDEATALLAHCTKNAKNKDITPAGYKGPQGVDNAGKELVISAVYYVLQLHENGEFDTVVMPLTSTQMKKSRQWNNLIQNARLKHPTRPGTYEAPTFGYVWHLTTIPESNDKGDWMGLKITKGAALVDYVDGRPVEAFEGAAGVYLAAREFSAMIKKGAVKVNAEAAVSGSVEEGGGADASVDDKPLPF